MKHPAAPYVRGNKFQEMKIMWYFLTDPTRPWVCPFPSNCGGPVTVFTGLSSPQCKAGIWWSSETPRNALPDLGKQEVELPNKSPGNPIGIAAKRRMSHVQEGHHQQALVMLVQKAKESSAAVEKKGGRCGMMWDHSVSFLGEKPKKTCLNW